MIIKNNIQVSSISWIKSGEGIIEKLFYPESLDELTQLCSELINKKEHFDVIGHTSNILFRNTYNPKIVISTKHLTRYEMLDDIAVCECGVHVRNLAKKMTDDGIKGFEGLIDLPGTVGAAIVGNAGCYSCLLSDLLLYIDFLNEDGKIVRIDKESLHFSTRMSDIKKGLLKGVVLRIYLKLMGGGKEYLLLKAAENHKNRLATQPGSVQNLGSIFSESGVMSAKYKWLNRFVKLIYLCLHWRKPSAEQTRSYVYKVCGHKCLLKYLDKGRWIWKDDKSYELFDVYVAFYKKMHPNAKLEIIELS